MTESSKDRREDPDLEERSRPRLLAASLAATLAGVFLALALLLPRAGEAPGSGLPLAVPAAILGVGSLALLVQSLVGSRGRSLRSNLVMAFLAASLLPLSVLAFLDQRTTLAMLERNRRQSLTAAASLAAASVDAFISAGLDAVRTESMIPELSAFLSLPPEKRAGSRAEAEALNLLNSLIRRRLVDITSYGLLDARGVDVLDTFAQDMGRDKSDRNYFLVPFQTGLPYASPVGLAELTGRPSLFFSCPVRNTAGRIVGILRARYGAAVLQRLLSQQSGGLGKGSHAALFDENGIRLADSGSPELDLTQAAPLDRELVERLRRERRLSPAAVSVTPAEGLGGLLASGGSGVFEGRLRPSDHAATVNAGVRLKTQPWILVFSQPRGEYLSGMAVQTRNAVLLVGIIAVAAAVLAWYTARRITRPLNRLTEAVRRAASGDLGSSAPVEADLELSILASAFNAMTSRLGSAMEGLRRNLEELRRTEEALRASEEDYRSIFENAIEGIFRAAPSGRMEAANPSMARILGYGGPAELLEDAQPMDRAVFARARDWRELVQNLGRDGTVSGMEIRLKRRDGAVIWVHVNARGIFSEGRLDSIEGTFEDITEKKRIEAQLHFQAFHDPLTGLANRALLLDRLGKAMERSLRRKDYAYSLVFLDLDRFKNVNDSLGHLAGDELLIKVGRLLLSLVRELDTVARLGGDEFVVLVEESGGLEHVRAIAERIRAAMAKPLLVDGREVFISASIGLMVGPVDASRPEDPLRFANVAMHHAKDSGKDCVRVFTPELLATSQHFLSLETDLRRALERGELYVEYQPILSLADGGLSGLEALVRWNHPQRGVIMPGEFIPVAEDTGLISQLGREVLVQACRQAALWNVAGGPQVDVSVNISGRQFAAADLAERVAQTLEETGLPAARLRLEITESVLMGSVELVGRHLQKLKDLGVRISVDDFGTGYSSLVYLQRFPVDVIKIDRYFVQHMELDPGNREIVRAIVSLSKSLQKSVVAEGIETAEQLRMLKDFGCGYGQGFFFSKSLPAREVVRRYLRGEEDRKG